MKKFLIVLLAVIIIKTSIYPRDYSLSFLKLPTTARQTSLSGYIALSDDVGGIFCNPSGIIMSSKQLGFTHNEHFQQIKYDFIGYISPKKDYTLFFGVAGLYTDNIEGRTGEKDFNPSYVNIYQVTEPDYYYNVYDIQTGIGFAKKIKSNISFGSTIKFVYEEIDKIRSSTILLDLGIQGGFNKTNNLVFGVVLNNFGFPIRYLKETYYPPTQIGFGAKYKIGRFNFVSDFVKPLNDESFVLLGSEIEIKEYFSFRLGYKYKPQGWKLEENYAGGSLGFGINYFGIKLDYSVFSYGELGLSHKITLIIEVDKIGNFYKLLREKLFRK